MKQFILYFLLVFSITYAKEENVVAVIGGGPAGFSAATMCQQMGYQTVVFEPKTEPPLEDSVSFWPGVLSPKWTGIIKNLRDSFTKIGGTLLDKPVSGISQDRDNFIVSSGKDFYSVQAVIIATGKHPKNHSFLYQRSDRIITNVWTGKIFSPKDSVIIIGQGGPLFLACLNAARGAGRVFVFPYQGNASSLTPLTKIFPSVTLTRNVSITDIGADKRKAFVTYSQDRSKLYKEASYLIVAEEKDPASELVENLCSLDSSGAIVASNDTGETSLPGLYACGDVTTKAALTGVQAAADGQKVGLAVTYFLVSKAIAPKKQPAPAPLPPPPPPEKESEEVTEEGK